MKIEDCTTESTDISRPLSAQKGRGAISNLEHRFVSQSVEDFDDGWHQQDDDPPKLKTTVTADPARSIISRNTSPDIPMSQSINPYKGCEHGCIYCFARPTHSYLDHSPGLDFESKLYYKPEAARLLEDELRKPGYRCSPITLGANTDPYQPIEKQFRISRQLLEVMLDYRQPVGIITKGALITEDLDILQTLAKHGLVQVMVSITSLDNTIKRTLEPRAAGPRRRLEIVSQLSQAGISTGIMLAPIIPAITDHEIEHILEAAAKAGANTAGYVLLRLPHEVAPLFRQWLTAHYPERASHVMSLINQSRGGKDYDASWGQRMSGTGRFADLIRQRFQLARRKNGLEGKGEHGLDCSQFRYPAREGDQLTLAY